MVDKKKILVLCTGNSCRSQLLHGYLTQALGDRATVYSAGVEVHGLNPRAVRVMAEDGVDISRHTSNHVDEYAQVPFDYVLTVCDHAQEACPVFPSTAQRLHHSFPDPARATGSEAAINEQFRAVRDQVRQYAPLCPAVFRRNRCHNRSGLMGYPVARSGLFGTQAPARRPAQRTQNLL